MRLAGPVAAVMLVVCVSCPGLAQDGPTVDAWSVTVDPALGYGCFAHQNYQDGTIFGIGLNRRAHTGIITIASPAWSSLQRGQAYELRLVFGSAPPRDRRATAIGIDGSITLWMTFIDTDVIVEFMEEPAVQIWSNKQLLRRTQLARQPERIPASDAMPGKNGRDHEECTSAAVSPGRKTRSASPIRERSLSHPRSRAVNPELVIISRLRSWVVPMNRVSREASEHIRTIVRLRLYGRDASAAIRRLELLRRALIPMRIQLEKLSSTEQDAKRPHKAMVVKLLSNTSKSRK